MGKMREGSSRAAGVKGLVYISHVGSWSSYIQTIVNNTENMSENNIENYNNQTLNVSVKVAVSGLGGQEGNSGTLVKGT